MKKPSPLSVAKDEFVKNCSRSWHQKVFWLTGSLLIAIPLAAVYFIFHPNEDSVFLNVLALICILGIIVSWVIAKRMSYFVVDEGNSIKNAFLHAVLPYLMPLAMLFGVSFGGRADAEESAEEGLPKEIGD